MLLGVDVGTTNTKVAVYARDGELLSHAQAPTPRIVAENAYEYFPAEELWQTVASLIKLAKNESGAEILALAVASIGESGVTLDQNGEPCFPIIPWNDFRSQAQMNQLVDRLEPNAWYNITGLYPNPIHTISKWLYLKQERPEIWSKTKYWLSVSSFIAYRLVGKMVMESSQAARTMAYDVNANKWSKELLKLANLKSSFLVPITQAGSYIGKLRKEAQRLTGLSENTAVYAGGHDHICAAFACGAIEPGVCLDSQGTAEGLVFGLSRAVKPVESAGFAVGPHVVRGHSYYLSGVYSAGASLKWLKDVLGIQSFVELQSLAEQLPTTDSPLFIANFLGAAPPFNQSDSKASFLNLKPEHSKAQLIKAVYEGIAFEIRRGVEAFENLTKEKVKVLRMVGSSAENSFWGLIRANIMSRPLELARHDDMVTAGAALIAGLGANVYQNPKHAIKTTYLARKIFYPDKDLQDYYEVKYQEYKSLAKMLATARRK